ncbi:MAG: hypothetical protein IT372_41120 [Polyangiaceae bacterium]|nr:hypothetical protein [Polyangiaceae bacterium]
MRRSLLLATLAAAPLLAGCGTAVYRPNTAGQVDLDPALEINDEDVRKAFEARPQLQPSLAVACYSFDPRRADELDGMVRSLPGVRSVYRIPPLLVTGERRFQEVSPWEPPKPVSVKKLRLLAARAHADVLMIFDYGYKTSRPANGLVAFNVALLPALFLPFLDLEVESYLETYVVDTRNGYLYGHLTSDAKDREDYVSIYTQLEERFVEKQWKEIVDGTKRRLGGLLVEEAKPRPEAAKQEPLPEPPREPQCPPAAGPPAEPAQPAPAPSPRDPFDPRR